VRLDIFFHTVASPEEVTLVSLVKQLIKRIDNMSVELEQLSAEVAANTAVDQSAIALLNGLSAQIMALKDDPVKLAALAAELNASSAALAAAVAANTPAAP
jgi:hypothetical protein